MRPQLAPNLSLFFSTATSFNCGPLYLGNSSFSLGLSDLLLLSNSLFLLNRPMSAQFTTFNAVSMEPVVRPIDALSQGAFEGDAARDKYPSYSSSHYSNSTATHREIDTLRAKHPFNNVQVHISLNSSNASYKNGSNGMFKAITPEEKQRRRKQGLCHYCGRSGHQIRQCPVRPNASSHTYRRLANVNVTINDAERQIRR
ncbi:hypothetical protein BC940DRAFT_76270 [Gongronella butleri]|nr:hypothetical protein BC940DRAFT_76270 [Gongronella butleri]